MERAGTWWGPGSLNPYQQFTTLPPDDVISGETLVFHGHFDVPAVSALSHLHTAESLIQMKKIDQALPELQIALSMNPNSLRAHVGYAEIMAQMHRQDEVQAEIAKLDQLAHTQYPEFQEPEFRLSILPYVESLLH